MLVARDPQAPVHRADAIEETTQAGSVAVEPGPSDAVVLDRRDHGLGPTRHRDTCPRRVRMLLDVGQRLRREVVTAVSMCSGSRAAGAATATGIDDRSASVSSAAARP